MSQWGEPIVANLNVRRDTEDGEIEHITVDVRRSRRSSAGTVAYELQFGVRDGAAAWKQIEELHPGKGSDGRVHARHLAVLFEAARSAMLNVPGVVAVEAFGFEFDESAMTSSEAADDVDRGEGVLTDGGEPDETRHVEHSDVGVSIRVELTRGTGTRDQEKIRAEAKAETIEDAREDMDELREYIHDLADDCRAIQPGGDDE